MAIELHLVPGALGVLHRSHVEGLFVGRMQLLSPARTARFVADKIFALLMHAWQPVCIVLMCLAFCSLYNTLTAAMRLLVMTSGLRFEGASV